MRISTLIASLALTAACRSDKEPEGDTSGVEDDTPADADQDGFVSVADGGDDCDDDDANVNPDATEACDGIDNNCDGSVDEGVQQTFWFDDDSDGYGDAGYPVEACDAPAGTVTNADDCDDDDAETYPGAPERCDGADNDCDGDVDEEVVETWYSDADGDGYGNAETTLESCDPPAGWVANGDDCDDTEETAYPGAEEVCDEVDNDCDGEIDEDAATAYYADADGDGFGDPATTVEACDEPEGYTTNSGDCDDTDGRVSPYATELCDGVDNDCDGFTDESDATDAPKWYSDADSDGYGDDATTARACEAPPAYTDRGGDCDDGDDAVNPDATEVCNGIDDDCNGWVDDDDPGVTGTSTWYIDYDDDGYGASTRTTDACDQPSGYVANADDCDDREEEANPSLDEVCDGIDNNCDGVVDEDSATDATTWYADADADGYGDAAASDVECFQPSGYVSDTTDCDDGDDTVFPGADELYDSQDNDCDGDVDEDLWMGTGNDGPLTVSGTTDLSEDASGSRTEPDAVAYEVTAISGRTITLAETVSGISAGDEVLLVNLQGSGDYHAAVGTYLFASVRAVSGVTIRLENLVSEIFGETSNSDLTDQVIVLQRVPHYTDVTVEAGGTLTTSPWNGSSGGVLAFRANGTVTVADGGIITVSELGYLAGETGTCNNCDAFQGESYAGPGVGDEYGGPYNEAIYGYLANYGGGGANVTGGGGNYGGGATAGDAWNPGTYTAPEAGEEYGKDDLSVLFFGSGGGGVWNGGTDTTGEDPGPGGDGAGILYIGAAYLLVEGADGIAAVGGTTEHWASGTWTYGAGGGAGGSVWLLAHEADLASGAVNAQGGLGQDDYTRDGGDGGDGRVRFDFNVLNGYDQGTSDADAALDNVAEPDPGASETPE